MVQKHKRKLSKKELKAKEKLQDFVHQEKKESVEKEKKIVKVGSSITVREFAALLSVPVTEVIKVLMKNGVLAAINENIDWETAAIVGDELGFEVKLKEEEVESQAIKTVTTKGTPSPRPPIVTVMGHVDHGKTQLLDTIRKSNVIATESGGITQHIGAYQVTFNGKKITFIDTPGHEAFEAMRAHGANITDIVVLVVAADEGVKPQTIEAYQHAKNAQVPIIVAINKIDLPNANVQKVKQQLCEIGLVPEDMGGDAICIPISAKQNINIDELLEMILLLAEMKGFKATPEKFASGVVIESKLDPKLGPTANLLVQDGTLKKGDFIIVGETWGKVRLMEDEYGRKLKTAEPSKPVKIAGIKEVPDFGQVFQAVPNEKIAQEVLNDIKKMKTKGVVRKIFKEAGLSIVLKADVLGSLKAIEESLRKIEKGEIKINIVKGSVGNITEDDIMMAKATNAEVYGFKVKISPSVKQLAERNFVKVFRFEIIYDLIDSIKKRIASLMKEKEEVKTGECKILRVFKEDAKEKIIGVRVTEGYVQNGYAALIIRGKKEIGRGKVISLQQEKKAVDKVEADVLAGVKLFTDINLEKGDVIAFYKQETKG